MTETTDPPGLGSVPIAQLEPSLTCSGKTFEGVVTLIWPYSASNASFSILLAEPDFRLRRQQGQVRIHFSGSSAKAVSRCDPQSGDQVILQLDGAQWEKDETVSKTPGRGINWQLRFEERATLKIQREGQEPVRVDIDHPVPSPEPRIHSSAPPESPLDFALPSTPIFSTTAPSRPQAWSTPAFLKRDRLSSTTYFGTDYDPFDEDEFRDNNRRKKTKFGRASDQWRFTEKSSSPEDESDTAKPLAKQAVESGAMTAKVNGHGNLITSGQPNRVDTDEPATPVNLAVQNAKGPADSEMVIDGHSTPQVPATEGAEHDIYVSDTAVQQADKTTVDEAVQTLRSGSEPPEQPSEVEGNLNIKDHEEDISVPGTSYTDRAVQLTRTTDERGDRGSPTVTSEEAESGSTPKIPPVPNIQPSNESIEGAAEAEKQVAKSTYAFPWMVDAVVHNQGILQDRTVIQEKLGFAEGDVDAVLDELIESKPALHSFRRSPDNSTEGSNPLVRAQSPPEQPDREEEHSKEEDYGEENYGEEEEEDDEDYEEEGDEQVDKPGQPHIEHDGQEWLEAKQWLRSPRSHDPTTLESGETERAERYLLEVEPPTGMIQQIDDTNDQKPNEPVIHTHPPQGQTLITTEEIHTTEGSLITSVVNSYQDEVQEQAGTVILESPLMPPRSPPRDRREPALLPLGNPSNESQEGRAAPMPHERALPQHEEVPQVLPSYPGPVAETLEQDSPPDFFSDDEEREWDPEEEDIIEEERQRFAGEPGAPDDGWSSEEEEWEYDEEELYPTEDASDSEEYSDDPGDEDNLQTPVIVVPPRTSAVEVISLLDSDDDDDSVGQSQTDGAAMSIFQGARPQSFLSKLSSPKAGVEPFDPSSPPLPSTVQDSQPSLYDEETEPVREDSLLRPEDVQRALDKASDEEEAVNGVNSIDVDDRHMEDAASEDPSSGKGLVIEDKLDPRLRNKVLTPNDTQPKDERSQTSDVSLYSIHNTHELPTPQLTQQRSSDVLLPASLRPSSPIVLSSSPPLSVGSPSSAVQTEESVPVVDHLRKLKVEVRLSTKLSPRARRISNIPASVSPWFAPRRSSEVIPASRTDSDDGSGEENVGSGAEEAEVNDVEEAEDDEEIPSSMPEVAVDPATSRSAVQRTFTPSPKPSPPYPTGLRTSHAYYAPLSTLPSHFNAQTSTLSIVLAATPIARASSGPRDFYTTIFLTDPSSLPSPLPHTTISPSTTTPPALTTTTIFRPTRSSLPFPLPSGSVLLLRSFTVTHAARTPSLLSTDTSAWALFPPHTPSTSPNVSGPPLEFGAEERGYVRGLWEWWDQLEPAAKTSVMEQAEEKVSKAVKKEERERVKGRRLKGMGLRLAPGSGSFRGKLLDRHELRDGKEWSDEVGGGSAASP
ncbi:MAG: hypothetical protein LQ346_002200, partial [Caloplaca aetnensis]